jgi:hypothetical protein
VRADCLPYILRIPCAFVGIRAAIIYTDIKKSLHGGCLIVGYNNRHFPICIAQNVLVNIGILTDRINVYFSYRCTKR